MPSTYAVIMAGGSGTRFWPASRRRRPKQLLPLGGDRSLLAEAVGRAARSCGLANVRIATGAHLAEATLAAVPELSRDQLLIEPVARNTAPCLAWAAATIARDEPDAVVMAMPADPHIDDEAGFDATAKLAIDRARQGVITTIGVPPTRPETGYGYIEAESAEGEVRDVARFVEKPDLATAQSFLKSGNMFWNAGMFFFRASDMVAAVRAHLPALADGIDALDAAARDGREAEALHDVFPTLPAVSIDHGVMEHVERMSVVPAKFGWSDLGSWPAVAGLADKDDDGNSAPEGTVFVDARNNHVVDASESAEGRTERPVIALVGVTDLVVVRTGDALLVMKADASQKVRDVVAALKARGDEHLV
ncbi:MAG TPA: mannose-6-phosphate isomerase [Polyangiaceae bacterium]|nr:mannose-6-phosphate isomerase [Polyangiaceae bacterium]